MYAKLNQLLIIIFIQTLVKTTSRRERICIGGLGETGFEPAT